MILSIYLSKYVYFLHILNTTRVDLFISQLIKIMMNAKEIQIHLHSLRNDLINHKLYEEIREGDDVRLFMESHVFAVWDFMSLLKSLQRNLTCVNIPWYPTGDASVRFLINEIVVGEESDINPGGGYISHFELYQNAMHQAGANTYSIHTLIESLQNGNSLSEAMDKADIDTHIREFLNFTFHVIGTGKPHLLASVFTFGREDLIPGMFTSLVEDLCRQFPDKYSVFKYYLDRHIEVDGGHHGHLSLRMVELLCGDDAGKWQEALEYACESLKMRKVLWDGILAKIQVNP